MKDVTPVILAGGLGTRLRSVVPDQPKVMAPVNGRPFLAYLFDQLLMAGFDRVILATGYKAEEVSGLFGDRYQGLAIIYSQESEPLGTGGGFRLASNLVHTDHILAMNGDSYLDMKVTDFIDWYFAKGYTSALVLLKKDDTSRYGRVEVDEEKRVVQFREKTTGLGPGFINGGLYLLKTSKAKSIPENQVYSLEEHYFPRLQANEDLYGYCCTCEFIDIGTPESYRRAAAFFGRKPGRPYSR